MKSNKGSIFISTVFSLALLSLIALSIFQYAQSAAKINSQAIKVHMKSKHMLGNVGNSLQLNSVSQGYDCIQEDGLRVCYIDYQNRRWIISITKERDSF